HFDRIKSVIFNSQYMFNGKKLLILPSLFLGLLLLGVGCAGIGSDQQAQKKQNGSGTLQAECSENEKRCDGDTLQKCKDGSWKKEKECSFECNESESECEVPQIGANVADKAKQLGSQCSSGDRKCLAGGAIVKCINNEWKMEKACAEGCNQNTMKCNQTSNQKQECTPGEKKCMAAGAIAECDSDGQWTLNRACPQGCSQNPLKCKGESQMKVKNFEQAQKKIQSGRISGLRCEWDGGAGKVVTYMAKGKHSVYINMNTGKCSKMKLVQKGGNTYQRCVDGQGFLGVAKGCDWLASGQGFEAGKSMLSQFTGKNMDMNMKRDPQKIWQNNKSRKDCEPWQPDPAEFAVNNACSTQEFIQSVGGGF
ncbi:MAG: hypothetical protein ABEJ24_02770, partial [Candidatus Magasanikbacteria bacterium]